MCINNFLCYAGGEWIGHYNQTTKMYTSLNQSNIDHSLRVVQILVDIHKDDPVIIGLEPREYCHIALKNINNHVIHNQ